jgi:hypothetical protein
LEPQRPRAGPVNRPQRRQTPAKRRLFNVLPLFLAGSGRQPGILAFFFDSSCRASAASAPKTA